MKQKHSYYIETIRNQKKEIFKFHFPPTKALMAFVNKIAKTGREVMFLRDNTDGRVLIDRGDGNLCTD